MKLDPWSVSTRFMSIGALLLLEDRSIHWLRSWTVAVVLAFCLKVQGLDPWLSIGLTLGLSLLIGLVHGLLVTKAGIQPFVVTLCGLLVYRSLGRWLTDNQSLGPVPLEGDKGYTNLVQIQGLDFIFIGKILLVNPSTYPPFIFLVILGIAGAVFLKLSGSRLYALKQ